MWIEGLLALCLLLRVTKAQVDFQQLTGCQQLRYISQQQAQILGTVENSFIPVCTEDGQFEQIQCNNATGICWCVDQQGFEVAGTRSNSFNLVNCNEPRDCGSLCRMLCPYGFKLAEDGCYTCECRNPCDNIICPADQECVIRNESCKGVCTPLPICSKQARSLDHLCPVGLPLMVPDDKKPFICGIEPNKPQCPVNYFCEVLPKNDYGVCCPLLEKPGTCPAISLLDDECTSTCNLDMECSGVQKCCFTENCGKICLEPANITLCLQKQQFVQSLLKQNPTNEIYIPQCSETGEFIPKQCNNDGRLCWCVDRNGTHIQSTMGPSEIVNCEDFIKDEEDNCNKTCEIECDTGFKYDMKGCKICECSDPCEKITCPEGSVCILMKEEPCFSNSCPPVPTCHKKQMYNCSDGIPLTSNVTGKLINCSDENCPSTHDCEILNEENFGLCCPKTTDIDIATSDICPEFADDVTLCENNTCINDFDCPDNAKCCPSQLCGNRICINFKPSRLPTMCEYLRDMGTKLEEEKIGPGILAIPIPGCRPDGTYESIQCDRSGQCWCVDDFGVEIMNTRAVSRSNVDCNQARSQRPCLGFVCRLGCDYGFVLDDKGCPLCECRNPCKNVKCPENNICQFYEVKCASNWCPPLPQCVPYEKARPTFPECPVGSPMVYEDTNLPVICDPKSNYQLCPLDHICTVNQPNEAGVCCPNAELGTNFLNSSDDILSSDTKSSPTELIKLGACPNVQSWESEICSDECKTDKDCTGPQKCCKNACGAYICRDPVGMTGKPGQCPYLVPVNSESCDYECSSDYDCDDTQKCCSNGCGTQCLYPITLTACQHQRAVAEHRSRELGIPASRMYLPSCTKDGNFEPIQCHPISHICWCVDENGVEIAGSRTLPGGTANCSSVGICEPIDCDLQCPNGLYLDERGCPICICRDPCQGVKCKGLGEVCRAAKVKCSNSPCPPLPLCLPNLENPCPFGEPLHNINSSSLFQCGPLGGQCPSSHKCHLSPLGEYAVCCPKPRDVCYQKLDPGHCKASLPRWYFDQKDKICKKFYYGGCGGSLNNFASREHCENTCAVISSCEHTWEHNYKLLKNSENVIFIPKCNKKTGEWEPLQCMEDVGICWCVNEYGQQLPGTSVRGVPYCTQRSGREFNDDIPLCPSNKPAYVCPKNMCENKICLANKNATCRINPCGGCKVEFYNEMNELINCEEGLSACFTEMQEVLNSNAWENHHIPPDHIDHLLPSSEYSQFSPPPAYPPPPPPPISMMGRSLESFIIENENHIPEGEETYPEQEDEDLQMSSSHVTIVVSPRKDGLTIRMSSQMGPKMLSNLLQDHLRFFHSFGLPVVKPGFCSSPSLLSVLRSMSQICRDRCFYDSDCPRNKKCCLSKCGMGCVDPYLAKHDVEPKVGSCPVSSQPLHRMTLACLFAQDECLQDDDCSGNYKCCTTECGNQCVEPIIPHIKSSKMTVTLPICSPEGGFAITQHQEDLSWCVDKYGNPLHETLTRGDVKCTTDGQIIKRRSVGPICPDANQVPHVCKNECMKATCTAHPDAICIADPCDECSVIFVNADGEKVNCEAKCSQPLLVGTCQNSLVRYFFNQSSQLCEQFIYNGCQGNDNNFKSFEECQTECEKPVPICEQPKDLGMCRAQIARWYYNKEIFQCEQFDYGGCGGNDNNFETKQECESKCPDLILCPQIKPSGQVLEPCSKSKACANEVCPGNPNAICSVDPCTCSVKFVDLDGHPVSCVIQPTPMPSELITPMIPQYTRCEGFLQRALLHWTEKVYTPQCTEDGNFVPTQCAPTSNFEQECWCVDESGSQLPNGITFPIGKGKCEFVKVKKVKVSLVFTHNYTIPNDKFEFLIKSLISQLLNDLSAVVYNDVVDVYIRPNDAKVQFVLVGDNNVQVAFQLEEMVRQGMKISQPPDIDVPANFGQSTFYYIIDPIKSSQKEDVLDNGITAHHVSYKKSETETETLIIIAIISTVVFLIVLAILIAIALSRKDKDEKPKQSIINQAFFNMIYALTGKKQESKVNDEKKEVQLAIQTIEAQYESIKQKEKEAEANCPSETSTFYTNVNETEQEKEKEKC
ncbi:uncharacterized protein [Centruroides vittatus]|uniref:uncharacterized protein n=1 Tax=Centruroides vittatus TaxID=120091 RepID=UPI00350FEA06